MKLLRAAIVYLGVSVARLVRWSLSAVEDEPPASVTPLPGPARGPVSAIELRLEDQRRRAS
jgi:hypothetical protein